MLGEERGTGYLIWGSEIIDDVESALEQFRLIVNDLTADTESERKNKS